MSEHDVLENLHTQRQIEDGPPEDLDSHQSDGESQGLLQSNPEWHLHSGVAHLIDDVIDGRRL